MTRYFLLTSLALSASFLTGFAADPPKTTPIPASDGSLVEKVNSARKEYLRSLSNLYDYYRSTGDRERSRWVEDEIKAFHLSGKPSYRLDIQDVPPKDLKPEENLREANELFAQAMMYKDKGTGTEYTLNQRRAEILLQEILQKYRTSDKLADVGYALGELYEGRAFRQFDRAAAYYERACQWRKGTRTDARLRAARLYDKQLGERSRAIEMYRDVIANDTDPDRLREAERRLAELLSMRK
jgi:hypothetical protein